MVVDTLVTEARREWLHSSAIACRVLPDLTALADLELLTHAGTPVRFGSAWENGPALLVFLRHYG